MTLQQIKTQVASILNNTDRLLIAFDYAQKNIPVAIATADDLVCTTIDNTYLFCHSVYDFLMSEEMQSWYRLIGAVCQLVYTIALWFTAEIEKQFCPLSQKPIIVEPAPQPAKTPTQPTEPATESPKPRKSRARKNPVT